MNECEYKEMYYFRDIFYENNMILKHNEEKIIPYGTVLLDMRHNDSDLVYILLEGKLEAVIETKQPLELKRIVIEGFSIAGDWSLFEDNETKIVSLTVVEDAKCIIIPFNDYKKILNSNYLLVRARLNELVFMTMKNSVKVECIIHMTKYEKFIYYIFREYMKNKKEGQLFIVTNTHSSMSKEIGCHIAYITHMVLWLENDGLISRKRGKIVVSQEQCLLMQNLIREILFPCLINKYVL